MPVYSVRAGRVLSCQALAGDTGTRCLQVSPTPRMSVTDHGSTPSADSGATNKF